MMAILLMEANALRLRQRWITVKITFWTKFAKHATMDMWYHSMEKLAPKEQVATATRILE